MLRLLYLSQARASSADDLDAILQTARQNNPPLSITGVLVHGGGWYMQLLEGPERSVLKLYARIIDDLRHADARVLHVTPANEAIFGEWSMGFVQRNPLEFDHVIALRARRLETVNASIFAETLKDFARRLRQQA
ncbi:MAG TPA: BLUF domain-containing protein [Solimonas sp.]